MYFFYCILLKKHQFFRFQNFKHSFLEIFKYHIEKNTCRLFFNIERDKTYFFRKKFWGVNYTWNDPHTFLTLIWLVRIKCTLDALIFKSCWICWYVIHRPSWIRIIFKNEEPSLELLVPSVDSGLKWTIIAQYLRHFLETLVDC